MSMDNYNIKYNNKKGALSIVFSGQLTINNIDKIAESLKSNLKKIKSVNISTDNVENIDLTFIQLLHSIIKSGKETGFEVNTSVNVPNDLKLLLTNAGFAGVTHNQ